MNIYPISDDVQFRASVFGGGKESPVHASSTSSSHLHHSLHCIPGPLMLMMMWCVEVGEQEARYNCVCAQHNWEILRIFGGYATGWMDAMVGRPGKMIILNYYSFCGSLVVAIVVLVLFPPETRRNSASCLKWISVNWSSDNGQNILV